MIGTALEIGMAKPMPSTVSPPILLELMPMTLPLRSTRGPPELPGLMAASVWMKVPEIEERLISRFNALTTPVVTDWP